MSYRVIKEGLEGERREGQRVRKRRREMLFNARVLAGYSKY